MFSTLVVLHALCTTLGYAGFIVTSAVLLALARNPTSAAAAVRVWRSFARVFGPLLGVGILLGFALAGLTHVPLASAWLLGTYAAVLVAVGAQAAVMVPWQRRANVALAHGEAVATGPVLAVAVVLAVAYTAIVTLMLLRPG